MVGYCAVIPLMTEWSHGKFQPIYYSTAVAERAVEAVIATWFFVLGTCIGSFLNVVVYRLPRGISITGSSYCPKCEMPIKSYDNIPIFGWLNLRGVCRICALPISPRYPIVELIVGTAFFVLAVVEISWGGFNLPHYHRFRQGFGVNLQQNPLPLAAIYGCHVLMVSVFTTYALISRDRARIPKRVATLAGVIIAGCTLVWPNIHCVAAGRLTTSTLRPSIEDGLAEVGLSILLGLVAAAVLVSSVRVGGDDTFDRQERTVLFLGCSLTGITLGWRSVPLFLTWYCYVEILLMLGTRIFGRTLIRASTSIAISAFLFLLGWRWFELLVPALRLLPTLVVTVAVAAAAGVLVARRSQLHCPPARRMQSSLDHDN